jgi:hypothetical protein
MRDERDRQGGGQTRPPSPPVREGDPLTRREFSRCIELDLTEQQLEILRKAIIGTLAARAADLRLLHGDRDPKAAIRNVAALGRLVWWLENGQAVVPDRTAWDLMSQMEKDVIEMDEALFENYERARAEHDALRAVLAHFEGGGVDE